MKSLTELKELLSKDQEEKQRVSLSLQLNICPVCGEKIIDEKYEKYDRPKKFLFGIIKIKGYTWDIRKVCSKDKNHYEYKENVYSSEI